MKILIGIDTGVKTGFAVAFDHGLGGELQQVCSLSITQAMDEVKAVIAQHQHNNVRLYIEDARQRTWVVGGRERLQGVGSVKRDADIWETWCKEKGVDCLMIHPKANATKLKADVFKRVTGWSKQTNEHGRDAAMLVHKRIYK